MTIHVVHSVSGWFFVYVVLATFTIAITGAVLISIGDWVTGCMEEWYRVKVLKQPPLSERVETKVAKSNDAN